MCSFRGNGTRWESFHGESDAVGNLFARRFRCLVFTLCRKLVRFQVVLTTWCARNENFVSCGTLWPWTECTAHDDVGLRMLFEMMYCPPDFGSKNHGIRLQHQTMLVYGDCLLCHILSQCAKGPSVETRYDVLEYNRLPALLRDRGYRHTQRVAETKRLAWQISFCANSSDTVCEPFSKSLQVECAYPCCPITSH